MSREYRYRLLLWLLLFAALLSRWSWPPKALLLLVSAIIWVLLTHRLLSPAQRWRIAPGAAVIIFLALPAGLLAIPGWPVLWQIFGASAGICLILVVANIVVSRYATTTDG